MTAHAQIQAWRVRGGALRVSPLCTPTSPTLARMTHLTPPVSVPVPAIWRRLRSAP